MLVRLSHVDLEQRKIDFVPVESLAPAPGRKADGKPAGKPGRSKRRRGR
jgi:hypothetical protein